MTKQRLITAAVLIVLIAVSVALGVVMESRSSVGSGLLHRGEDVYITQTVLSLGGPPSLALIAQATAEAAMAIANATSTADALTATPVQTITETPAP